MILLWCILTALCVVTVGVIVDSLIGGVWAGWVWIVLTLAYAGLAVAAYQLVLLLKELR